MTTRKEKYAEVEKALQARLNVLRAMKYADICALPEYGDTFHNIDKWEFTLATYFTKLTDNTAQIVVQAYHRGILGTGAMWADGFLMSPDNEQKPLPDDTRYEYC
jgi:hypothetical protein